MLDFLEIWLSKYNPNFSARETEKVLGILNERTDSSIANKFKLLLVKAGDDKKEKKEKNDKKMMNTSSSNSPSRGGPPSPTDRDYRPFSPLTESIPNESDLKNFNFNLLEEHPPSLIARQLTLYEWDIYSRVKPEEFLNQSWAKAQSFTLAPNISRLIENFNKVQPHLFSARRSLNFKVQNLIGC